MYTTDNAKKWQEIRKMKWTDDDHKGWTKWGEKPYWTQDLWHLNGIVTKINGNGTYEVKFHHPCDRIGEMNHSATMTIEYNDIFSTYEYCKHRINRYAKKLKVGSKVKVNEYSNLFYIYKWELRMRYGEFKYEFICGEPHSSFKKKYTIDAKE